MRKKINANTKVNMIEGKNTTSNSKRSVIPHRFYLYCEFIFHIESYSFILVLRNRLDSLKPSRKRPKFGANDVSIKDNE